MRKKGENSVKCAGKSAIPPDGIMISPLMLKVNVPTLLTAAFHRHCLMVEATPAAQHACALHCHKRDLMPACRVPVLWVTSSLLSKIAQWRGRRVKLCTVTKR